MAVNHRASKVAEPMIRHVPGGFMLLGLLLASCAQQSADAAADGPMSPPVAVVVSGSVHGMSHDALWRIVDSSVAQSERVGCGNLASRQPELRMQWSVLDNRPKAGIAIATVRLYEAGTLVRQSATRIHDPSSVTPSTMVHDFAAISAELLGCGSAPRPKDL